MAVLKETFSEKHLDGMKTDQTHETVVEQKLKSTEYAITNSMSWCDQPFTMEELTKKLKMKVNCKGVDDDSIHPKMLKNAGHFLKTSILDILNKAFSEGHWPWNKSPKQSSSENQARRTKANHRHTAR